MNKKKVILTDIDGVLLDWRGNLLKFMLENYNNVDEEKFLKKLNSNNHIHLKELVEDYDNPNNVFNGYSKSKHLKNLPYYEDALIINELKNEYIFIGITAVGKNEQIREYRRHNLELFFPKVFKEVLHVDPHESKAPYIEYLSKLYKNRIVCFVDDYAYNLNEAYSVNNKITQVFLNRNTTESIPPIVPYEEVKNWQCIKEKILK